MPRDWREITAAHVMEAIRRYDEHPERYTKARHTSIIHEGKEYPAKAIRGIAMRGAPGDPARCILGG